MCQTVQKKNDWLTHKKKDNSSISHWTHVEIRYIFIRCFFCASCIQVVYIDIDILGGGFKYFLFSPLFGEDFHFDDHIFQMGGSTTNQHITHFFKHACSRRFRTPLFGITAFTAGGKS